MRNLETQNRKLEDLNGAFESRIRAIKSTVGHCAVHGRYLTSPVSSPSGEYIRGDDCTSLGDNDAAEGAEPVASESEVKGEDEDEDEDDDGFGTDTLMSCDAGEAVVEHGIEVQVEGPEGNDDLLPEGYVEAYDVDPFSEETVQSVGETAKAEAKEVVAAEIDEAEYVSA